MKRAFYLVFAGLILPLALLVVLVGSGIPGRLPASQRTQTVVLTRDSQNLSAVLTPAPVAASQVSSPTPDINRDGLFAPDPVPARGTGSLCTNRAPLMVLLIGADSREDSYVYGLADVIRLVRVDFQAPRLTVLAIPRDLWVAIPGIADHYGITHGKINQAYLYGGEGMGYFSGPGGGPGLLALTLKENYGLEVDRYLAVNMVTFVKVVDALDGVEVTLPEAVDGRPARGGDPEQFFPAGEQHLDGEAALRLARLRTNYDDLVRSQHQDLVLEALRAKLFSPAVVTALPELVDAFKGSIVTDLGLREIAGLLCLAPQLDEEHVTFARIPPAMLKLGREVSAQLNGSVSVLKTDPQALSSLLAGFQAGVWP